MHFDSLQVPLEYVAARHCAFLVHVTLHAVSDEADADERSQDEWTVQPGRFSYAAVASLSEVCVEQVVDPQYERGPVTSNVFTVVREFTMPTASRTRLRMSVGIVAASAPK